MTIKELHYEFHLLMDTIGSNGKRSFSIAEVDWLLNKAQTSILNQYTKEFEKNLSKTHELSSLHVKWPKQPFVSVISHSMANGVYNYELNLNSLIHKYYAYTKIETTLLDGGCEISAYGRYMDNDDMSNAKRNSFDLDDNVVFFNIGQSTIETINTRLDRSIYLYSKHPIKDLKVYIEYIREPKKMNYGGYTYIDNTISVLQECELPDQLHTTLVDTAVMLAYNALNDQSYNLKKDIISN